MSILSAVDDVARISFKALEPNGGISGSWSMRLQEGAQSVFVNSRNHLDSGVQATGARPGQPVGIFSEPGGFSAAPLTSHRNGFAMIGPETPPLGPSMAFEFGHLQSAKGSRLVGVTSLQPNGQLGRVFEADVMSNMEMYNRGLIGAKRP